MLPGNVSNFINSYLLFTENAEKQGKVHGNDDDDRHIEEGSIPFLSTNATQPKELKPDAGSPVECNEVEEESSSVTDNGSENDAGSHSSDNEILGLLNLLLVN